MHNIYRICTIYTHIGMHNDDISSLIPIQGLKNVCKCASMIFLYQTKKNIITLACAP